MMSGPQSTQEKLPNAEASAAAEDLSKTVYGQPVMMSESEIMGQPAPANQAAPTASISAKKYETAAAEELKQQQQEPLENGVVDHDHSFTSQRQMLEVA